MAKEIERKFLVKSEAWRSAATSQTRFLQAYVASLDDRSVRVRMRERDSATLTIKIGQGMLTRDEFEYDIPLDDAEQMIACAIGIVIEKTRYTVDHEGFVWEVDVFHGAHDGLVIAEVELESESDKPALPAWVGREVTGDRRYSNQMLATHDTPLESTDGLSHKAG
ncbi:MAG: CYTH domain-containing protein [Allorhizobium sp.]